MGIQKFILLLAVLIFATSQTTFAQTEKDANKKIVIITKTKDEDGKEVTKKIIQEGEEVNEEEINKMINEELEKEGFKMKIDTEIEKEIEEEVIIDENGKKVTTKRIKMKVSEEDLEMGESSDHIIIKRDGKEDINWTQEKTIEIESNGETEETIDLGDGIKMMITRSKDSEEMKKGDKEKDVKKKKKIKVIVKEGEEN